MNRKKSQISLSNSVLPNTLVCYGCWVMGWRSIGKICSENIVLKKICLEIQESVQENSASLCSEHQNCEENITCIEHEVETNI